MSDAGLCAPDRGCRTLTRFAIACLWVGVLAGLLASLSYTSMHPLLRIWGLTLQTLRPLHLAAGVGWVYLGGIAVVTHHWSKAAAAGDRSAIRGAVRFFLATWFLGAAVVGVCLLWHVYGGRQFFFISAPSSVLFWMGWVVLSWTYARKRPAVAGPTPVYLWMWMSSLGLFTYAFVETHVFLLPYFRSHPLRDMAVEWKSYGTLVGSFNLLVYGGLAYLGDQLKPGGYARSRPAFALFFVGVLNSFTNYGHHTYHLPQAGVVKWVSFIVSMTEIVLLAKVVLDVAGWMRRLRSGKAMDGVSLLLCFATVWTFFSLTISIAISVPPLNALIHGTLVVAGHAMGSMLGIDTVALLAVLGWLQVQGRGGAARVPKWAIFTLNTGILVLWLSFLHVGASDSLQRWNRGTLPSSSLWPGWFGRALLGGGLLAAVGIFGLTWSWVLGGRPEGDAPREA